MENFIHELKALNFQNHKVSIIGNHSWASAAMKTMVAHFENDFKDIEIVSEPLDIKSSLKEEDIPSIEKMADDIKASIDAKVNQRSIIIYILESRPNGAAFFYKTLMKLL